MEKPKRVYLVDDDPDDRYLVCEALTQVSADITIIEAIDGQHFFELIGDTSPDSPALILLDVNMPRMDGLETLSKIKTKPSLAALPIVMFSTSGNQTLIEQAHREGVTAFFVKPTSFEGYIEFAAIIAGHLH
ncbi:response regulator [Dyadobacter sp. CY347]|uniref:response regulator n=1 Tax=Dyadobacter sp. CY347 TaxID=2909336 RepID=UPI001F337808|nr:response regulator [Dyadobacter sp. CY347]MCF2489313.1 response regulator [Dyadobacter sp. CY347]